VKLIRCECGYVARGDSDDQVIGMIRGHMSTDHPARLDPGGLALDPGQASPVRVTSTRTGSLPAAVYS
jgi:hypothetical protein